MVYPRRSDNEEMIFHWATEYHILREKDFHAFYVWVDDETDKVLGVHHPGKWIENVEVLGSIVPVDMREGVTNMPLPYLRFHTEGQSFFADALGQFNLSSLPNLIGEISLRSKNLEVVNNGGTDGRWEGRLANGSINLDNFTSLEERNIYYWVKIAQDHVRDDLNYREMNGKLTAMANFGRELDNAFFNPLLNALGFGAGKRLFKNTALSRDIILHEYGHALTHSIYGIRTSYEFRAMNEAFSDYFAATLTDNPEIGEDAMLDRPFLRNLENDYHYDSFFKGQYFHRDGQLFGGALWRLRQSIGAEKADALIHEARLAGASRISDFLRELLFIDEAKDDGNFFTASENHQAIADAFFYHGLHSRIRFQQAGQEDFTTPWFQSSCWSGQP